MTRISSSGHRRGRRLLGSTIRGLGGVNVTAGLIGHIRDGVIVRSRRLLYIKSFG